MFRRLAELSQTTEPFDVGNTQNNYVQSQSLRYNTILPNIIPTGGSSPAPPGIEQAVQGVNTDTNQIINPQANISSIFVPANVTQNVSNEEKVCEAGSLDGLMGSQDPNRPIRCGWMYTSPPNRSPFPVVSKGALGTSKGPLNSSTPYSKWFWDLEEAKKQILIDKCKALRNCTDVGKEPYGDDCGYCKDLGQGIPIDKNGNPLYRDSTLTNCSPESIIRTANKCSPPVENVNRDSRSCVPISGRLPYGCLESILDQAGCANGSISVALSTGATPNDYMASARKLKSMQIFNERAKRPFPVDVFGTGKLDVATALSEAKNLAAIAKTEPETTGLGAAARDLCLQKGDIDKFDFCTEINLNTPPPYSLECLQKAFLQAGGTPLGRSYPTIENVGTLYNSFSNWGRVLDYINGLVSVSKGVEGFDNPYLEQSRALQNLRGIRPEDLVKRAPLLNGVEVFWYNAQSDTLENVTFESYFPTFEGWNWGNHIIPQLGRGPFAQFVALTDIRNRTPTQLKFRITSDDGFRMSLNQSLMQNNFIDKDGYWAIDSLYAPTTFYNNTCWNLSTRKGNVMKLYWHDKGGGVHSFRLDGALCNTNAFDKIKDLSLTREVRAPFLLFENVPTGGFADLRLPEMFNFSSYGNLSSNTQIFNDADSKMKSPGKNGFIRFLAGDSLLRLRNISSAVWNTITFVFKINTMPVNNNFFSIADSDNSVWFVLNLKPISGSSSKVEYISSTNPNARIPSTASLNLSTWYMGIITQNTPSTLTSWSVSFVPLETAQKSGSSSIGYSNKIEIPSQTRISERSKNRCDIGFGAVNNSEPKSFQWDIAWIHIFNNLPTSNEIQRDANNDWLLTLP